ncbi:MAG: hypothetical protein K6A36_05040 [Paludibacteraceae bacterium]|nr:hypothetical protein [Paludibacteraceae bacterium]
MRRVCYILALLFVAISIQAQQVEENNVEEKNYPTDTIDGEIVYRYQVEKSIGLYRIGVNFNVQQSDIVRLNPQLKERGLHYGETIFIPTGRRVNKRDFIKRFEKKVEEYKADTLTTSVDTIAIDSLAAQPTDSLIREHRIIEIALMLPFESQQSKRSGNSDKMTEFYQGVLLALHELQNDSTSYRLRVFDTERSERRVNTLCDSTILDSVNGILGLAYPIQIERMSIWCEHHQVPLLVPFTDDTDLNGHSQLIQFNATDEQKADSICNWIKKHDLRCIAVDVHDAEISASIRTLRKRMKKFGIPCSSLALRELMSDSAAYALSKDKENLIILHSDRINQVRLVIPHIEALRSAGYNIRIVSQYSWQKENIRLPQIYTSMFTSEAEQETYDETWNRYYANNHVSESPRYDLLGYDLLNMLVAHLNGITEYNGLQSEIRLQRLNGRSGWQNANVIVVEK